MTTVALAIICHDRPLELMDALASAAGDAWEEVVVLDMASEPPLTPIPGVIVLRSDANVGVTSGRNRLLKAITADVIFFLDDDAVLTAPAVEQLCLRFDGDEKLAVVACRVRRRDGASVSSEYPFRGPAVDDPAPRPCAYFVGCAYAARRSAVSSAGGYDESFFYSTEEVDLSLKLLARGWRLMYDPGLTIEHHPSPRGRSVAPRVPALLLRNRVVVARRHLPLPAAVVHLSVWGGRTFLTAARAGGLHAWLRAWGDGMRAPVDRQPLSWRGAVRIHRLGGRVLW